jgi:biotin carboxyl carrier protein
VADVTELGAGTDTWVAVDGGSDGHGPPGGAVRVSLVGRNPNDAAARIVLAPGTDPGHPTIDGRPVAVSLRWLDGIRARLETSPGTGTEGDGSPADAAPADEAPGNNSLAAILLLPPAPATSRHGVMRREVVVDGWRFEVEVELEARAALRERASRAAAAHVHEGPFEVRAVIPGRIVSVEVVPGDSVAAGQRVMIIEAMKMQNELRVPRDGTVGRIVAGAGQTIEVGDLLLVLE